MIITFLALFHFIFSETIPIKADELADYINSKYMPNYYLLFDENNILSPEQKQTIESNLAAVFKESEYFIYCLVKLKVLTLYNCQVLTSRILEWKLF